MYKNVLPKYPPKRPLVLPDWFGRAMAALLENDKNHYSFGGVTHELFMIWTFILSYRTNNFQRNEFWCFWHYLYLNYRFVKIYKNTFVWNQLLIIKTIGKNAKIFYKVNILAFFFILPFSLVFFMIKNWFQTKKSIPVNFHNNQWLRRYRWCQKHPISFLKII